MSLLSFRKRHPPAGARPGTLVVPEKGLRPRIFVTRYTPDELSESEVSDVEELLRLRQEPGVSWVDVRGLGDIRVLERIGDVFDIHPLALEDVVNAPQRPKCETYEQHVLLVVRTLALTNGYSIDAEQVSIVFGKDYVLSFQERHDDPLAPVRQRLREAKGPIRSTGPDYLAYALLDTVVDGYYPLVESLSERVEELDAEVMAGAHPRVLDRVNRLRAILATVRRIGWPQREALSRLIREQSAFFSENVRVYLRDTYDHCAQLVDVVDALRDVTGGLVQTYLSVESHRTNEIMRVLTVMASIFIPLTFLAGIYGMNFDSMPELHSRWGYPAVLSVMLLLVVGMLVYFHRKGFIGGGPDAQDDRDGP